jgi:hypothetical protein
MVFAVGTCAGLALSALSQAQPQISGGTTAVKQVGAIKSIAGSVIVLTPDAGSELRVLVQDSTRIVRIAPGEKDLKNATSISLHDLQPGDRILVRGKSADSGELVASGIIVMKHSDLEVRQQREREDWQKRGVAGLVSGVDATSDTITISIGSLAGKKSVVIHTTKETVVRRYAPDSVRFDDAKPSTLAQTKPGDQLRARGTRNADASELIAEEIVSGSFRNIAGTIGSVNASSGTVTVLDLATKKPVVVKVTGDSQLRNLPPEMAKRLAMRMMGASAPPGGAAPNGAFRRESMGTEGEDPAGGQQRRGDIQQMFNHLPPLSVPEMQKGDTVMLVATEGSSTGAVTAIKLLDGVEPILARSAKNGGETMTLSPWSLGGQGEDASP